MTNDVESSLWSIVLGPNVGRSSQGRGDHEQLAGICPVDRTVVVLSATQPHNVDEPHGPDSVRMVFEPDDRGTAARLLLGLLVVLTTEPGAIVLVIPSHQTAADAEAFKRQIDDAVNYARRHFDVVLLGAGPAFGRSINDVVIVAQARALLHLCRQRLPAVSSVFVAALTMPIEARRRYLSARYSELRSRDLAEHVLMAPDSLVRSTWTPSVLRWSDVASPEHVEALSRRVEPPAPARSVQTKRVPFASETAASLAVN